MQYYIQVSWPLAFSFVGFTMSIAFMIRGFPQINIGCHETNNFYDDDGDDDDELSNTFVHPPGEYKN